MDAIIINLLYTRGLDLDLGYKFTSAGAAHTLIFVLLLHTCTNMRQLRQQISQGEAGLPDATDVLMTA
jgi:hypothetical protein